MTSVWGIISNKDKAQRLLTGLTLALGLPVGASYRDIANALAADLDILPHGESAHMASEVADESGNIIHTNDVRDSMFTDSSESPLAAWKGWDPAPALPKIDPPAVPVDYFIPISQPWRKAEKRMLAGRKRRAPPQASSVRILGYASHSMDVLGQRLIVTLYVDVTTTGLSEEDLAASFENAKALLDQMFQLPAHSARFCEAQIPFNGVGGDFVFYRAEGTGADKRELLVVGDCAGKQMRAALQNVIVNAALAKFANETPPARWDPAEALYRIDAALCELIGLHVSDQPDRGQRRTPPANSGLWDMGADACAVIVDHGKRAIQYASAELPLLVIHSAAANSRELPDVQLLGSDFNEGKKLGPLRIEHHNRAGNATIPRPTLEVGRQRFRDHDLLVAFTDGLTHTAQQANSVTEGKTHALVTQVVEPLPHGPLSVAAVLEVLVGAYHKGVACGGKLDDVAIAVLACADHADEVSNAT